MRTAFGICVELLGVDMPELQSDFLFTIRISVDDLCDIGATPFGTRHIDMLGEGMSIPIVTSILYPLILSVPLGIFTNRLPLELREDPPAHSACSSSSARPSDAKRMRSS